MTKPISDFSGHNSFTMPFAPTIRNPVSLPCFVKLDGDFCHLHLAWMIALVSLRLLSFCLTISMMFHSMFFACCVGEADNPGPQKTCTRFAITNPTAVYGKLDKICAFDADAVFVSESSATTVVQKDCTYELAKHKYNSFWSLPVAAKKQTLDNRPSYRGEAVGSAIFTRLPARKTRCEIHEGLWNTQRFSTCILRFGKFEILAIAVYGFANRHKEGIRPNDILLASLIPVVEQVGLPYIIGGDFNEVLTKLPSYRYFQECGAIEAFQWHRLKFGIDLPATCSGSTCNDTAIMHPMVAEFISSMSVPAEFQLDVHTPLFIDFDLSFTEHEKQTWTLPKSWAPFAPPPELIAQEYHNIDFGSFLNEETVSVGDVEDAFLMWSKHVEKAVDRAIQKFHACDPIKHPIPCLHRAFKGRCSFKKTRNCNKRQSVRNDRHGGFNPTEEVFHLRTKLKVRQVRRIKSLIRRLKSLGLDDTGTHDIQINNEWKKILAAKGYGHSWKNWILGFDCIEFLPVENIPDVDLLNTIDQITEHDCNHACFAEARFRSDKFRAMMAIDQQSDFCKTTYKMLKAKKTETLAEVPSCWRIPAKLMRSKPGSNAIKMSEKRSIPSFATLHFGDAKIELVSQEGDKILFKILDGVVPAEGILKVEFVAVSVSEIGQEFRNFWAPMWLRDKQEDQFNDSSWSEFETILNETALPEIPSIIYPWDDMQLWRHIIKRLPSAKAIGPCGWSNDEIKGLPDCCIRDLIQIFKYASKVGFGPCMMTAKTILLSKVQTPLSMHHARPITILSCLYRLYGKFIFRVTANVWKNHFAFDISGGLPGRGVKELAYTQKRVIEDAMSTGDNLGGYSLDLIKAYNTFGRFAIGRIMMKLGMPAELISAWIHSLDKMVRFSTIQGCIDKGISATTGVPEGCSISVLSVLATSCLYHSRLRSDVVRPFAYADNWSWMVKEQRAHFSAYQRTLNLVDAMKLNIDHNKSWHWAIKKQHRDFCKTFSIPNSDAEVQVKSAVKDLGESVSYNKSVSLGFIKDKIDEAITRLHRLEWMTASLSLKARLIQSTVWPLALYSSDTSYIGQQHYTALRRAAVNALVGKWHNSSPIIACTFLSKFLIDPFLYTILQCLRVLRRMATNSLPFAQDTIKRSVKWNGKKPFGPATALKQYFQHTGWTLSEDGTISGPEYITCNVLKDSCRYIVKSIRQMWDFYILQLVDRKGVGDFVPDLRIFHSALSKLTDGELNLVKLNVVGAFQTQMQKSKWDKDCSAECELCGEEDTREHRLLHCCKLQSVRDVHADACTKIANDRPEWIFFPIPRMFDQATLLRAYVMTIKRPEISPPHQTRDNFVRFFTDGGTRFPREPVARIATWAVVQDISESGEQRRNVMDFLFTHEPAFPLFKVSQVGIAYGEQTVARAELIAFLVAVKKTHMILPLPRAEFVTDASYVCKVIQLIELGFASAILHRLNNCDIIAELVELWRPHMFVVTKVKSHREFSSAVDHRDLWLIAGNHCADIAVGAANKLVPNEIWHISEECVSHSESEKKHLLAHLKYLADFNRERCRLLDESKCIDLSASLIRAKPDNARNVGLFDSHAMGWDAVECMKKFCPAEYTKRPPIACDDEVYHRCLQGANIAKSFKTFCEELKWPPDLTEDYDAKAKGDWGISWFEILTSFYLSTGWRCPIKTSGSGAKAEYISYGDPKAILLPDSKRTVSLQILCLRNLLQNVSTIVEADVLPKFSSYKCFSMSRIGLKSPIAGLPCRPIIPKQSETLDFVWHYFLKLNGSVALHKPIHVNCLDTIINVNNLEEKTPHERWSLNQAFMKKIRARNLGGA